MAKDIRIEVYFAGRFIGAEIVQTDKGIESIIAAKKEKGLVNLIRQLLKKQDNN